MMARGVVAVVSRYDHVPEVRQGRQMMVKQLSTMQRRVWDA